MLKPILLTTGYRVNIYLQNGSHVTMMIHRIVARLFVKNNNPDSKIFVNHKNGNRQYNHYSNLSWDAVRKNIKTLKGTDSPRSKYTEEQVNQVCKLLTLKVPIKLISEITNVNSSICYSIKNKLIWTHISKNYKLLK